MHSNEPYYKVNLHNVMENNNTQDLTLFLIRSARNVDIWHVFVLLWSVFSNFSNELFEWNIFHVSNYQFFWYHISQHIFSLGDNELFNIRKYREQFQEKNKVAKTYYPRNGVLLRYNRNITQLPPQNIPIFYNLG